MCKPWRVNVPDFNMIWIWLTLAKSIVGGLQESKRGWVHTQHTEMKILFKSQFAYALDTYDKKLASLGPNCKAEVKLELRFLSKFKNLSLPVNAIYRLTNKPTIHCHTSIYEHLPFTKPRKEDLALQFTISNVCAFTELAI